MAAERGLLRLELGGEGVNLDTVDTCAALELALQYFRLLSELSEALDGKPLKITGIRALPGSAVLAGHPSNQQRAAKAVRRLDDSAKGRAQLPTPVSASAKEFYTLVRRDAAYSLRVRLGKLHRPITAPSAERVERPAFTTSLRARLVRVGGASPTAMLASKVEGDFTASIENQERARELATHLYADLDFVIRARLSDDGSFDSAVIVEFEPLAQGDGVKAMREWAAEHRERWAGVQDPEGEIRRDRD